MMNWLVVSVIGGALLTGGCGATQKKPVARPGPSASSPEKLAERGATGFEAPARVEAATGDLRAALLSLNRVHFALDSATLETNARDALVEAADRLRRHPEVHLFVDGHTDERGTTEYNVALSERRAQAVTEYLTRLGISSERLRPVPKGEEAPIAVGDGEQSWALNRRVEFRLMRGDVRLELREGRPLDDQGRPMEGRGSTTHGSTATRPVAVR